MSQPYPLLCVPHCQPRIWGGRRLAELYGKQLPGDEPIGETWEVADLPEGSSTIAHGPLAGQPLGAAVAAWGADLVGTAWPAGQFPLLVKLLDARCDLSVQVHPADEDCARWFPDHHGKDESWLVLATDPGGAILHGVTGEVTWEQLEQAFRDGTVYDLLRRVEVAPGDFARVAPGTIHALQSGVVVLEIQQPSDSTFRLYDYGRGRELHLAQARRVVRLKDNEPPLRTVPRRTREWGESQCLIDVPAYRIERHYLTEPASWRVEPRTCQVLFIVEGRTILTAGATSLELAPGQAVILPAVAGEVSLTPVGLATVVVAGAGGAALVG